MSKILEKKSYKELLLEAQESKIAVGAFNIFNFTSAKAVVRAAEEEQMPVIIQTSTKTVKKIGVNQLASMLHLLAEQASVPVFSNLDHCRDPELAKQCVDAGWDSVMIDASDEPLEENIRITKEIVAYASPKGVAVEGEVGIIKGVEEDIVAEEETPATYDDTIRFIQETGIDAIAPAIGTAHGFYRKKPSINFELVQQLGSLKDCPVVLHGGTGLSDETFHRLIHLGAAKVNISTALKHACIDTAKEYLEASKIDPLELDQQIEKAITEIVRNYIRLFSTIKSR